MSIVSGKTLPAPCNALQGSDTIDMAARLLTSTSDAVLIQIGNDDCREAFVDTGPTKTARTRLARHRL